MAAFGDQFAGDGAASFPSSATLSPVIENTRTATPIRPGQGSPAVPALPIRVDERRQPRAGGAVRPSEVRLC